MLPKAETIAAIATASGRGGIGIVRVSGNNLMGLAEALLGKKPEPRYATYASFLDTQTQIIDQGIVLFFPAPHSYTGEDILELHGHGGTAVLQLVLHRCLELGARLAQPGEFTLRAYLNGKMDLAQAESVIDLIDATTSQAARCAMRSLQGEFSRAIQGLVDELIQLRTLVEAMLDFPDEEIESTDVLQCKERLTKLRLQLEHVLDLAKQGSLLREGAHIVLVGQPNVGKSSLLNCLSGEEVALVSEIPGTTRDVIRQAIQIEGVPLHVLDTAGLRESADVIEQMGISRTHGAVQKADVILVILNANIGISNSDHKILDTLPPDIPRLFVFNKIDLIDLPPQQKIEDGENHIYLSAKTGKGIDLLRRELLTLIGWHQEAGVFMARSRHLSALREARNLLQQAAERFETEELFAENLRVAQEYLGEITGEFTADDLLGEIFGRFCIGK